MEEYINIPFINTTYITVPAKTPHFLDDNKNKWLVLAVYSALYFRFKSCHLDQIKKRSVRAGRFFHALYRPATTIAEGQLAFLPIDPVFFPTEFLIEKNQKPLRRKQWL